MKQDSEIAPRIRQRTDQPQFSEAETRPSTKLRMRGYEEFRSW